MSEEEDPVPSFPEEQPLQANPPRQIRISRMAASMPMPRADIYRPLAGYRRQEVDDDEIVPTTPFHVYMAQRIQEAMHINLGEFSDDGNGNPIFSDVEMAGDSQTQAQENTAAEWNAIAAQWIAISRERSNLRASRTEVPPINRETRNTLIPEDPWVWYRKIIASPYTQFLFVLLLKGICMNYEKAICLVLLLIAFPAADSLFKAEVAKGCDMRRICVIMLIITLVVCISYNLYEFRHQDFLALFIFQKPKVDLYNFWNVFWVIGVADYITKLGTIIIKAVILCLPDFANRGPSFAFLERSAQLYRCLLPISPWIYFYAEDYKSVHSHVIGLLLACTYGAIKTYYVIGCSAKWIKSLQMMYGVKETGMRSPTSKELLTAGPQCPICFESFKAPLRLECCHIYCRICIQKWFHEERSCPICRTKIAKLEEESDGTLYQDGATSHYVYLF